MEDWKLLRKQKIVKDIYFTKNLQTFRKSGLSTDGEIDRVLLVGPMAPAQ
jgi:hypothetical protein